MAGLGGWIRSTLLAAAIFPSILAAAADAQQPVVTVVAGDPAISAMRVAAVERLVPRALATLSEVFPGQPSRPFRVVLHRSAATLSPQLRDHLHPGTPGFALLGRDELHLLTDEIRRRPPNDLSTVLTHEIVHVLLDQYAGPNSPRVPRWLHEGLAQHLSGENYLGSSEEDLYYPARLGRLPRFGDLADDFPEDRLARRQAYAQSASFVGWLVRQVGLDAVVESVRRMTELDGYVGGFALRTRTPLGTYIDAWSAWLRDESGAGWRLLFSNCFSYLMIGSVVLLALAGARRLNRDAVVRRKLEREELEELEASEALEELDDLDDLDELAARTTDEAQDLGEERRG